MSAEATSVEYRDLTKYIGEPIERVAVWQEHCERQHRSEAKVWGRIIATLAIVAAFFAGFAAAAVWMVGK